MQERLKQLGGISHHQRYKAALHKPLNKEERSQKKSTLNWMFTIFIIGIKSKIEQTKSFEGSLNLSWKLL